MNKNAGMRSDDGFTSVIRLLLTSVLILMVLGCSSSQQEIGDGFDELENFDDDFSTIDDEFAGDQLDDDNWGNNNWNNGDWEDSDASANWLSDSNWNINDSWNVAENGSWNSNLDSEWTDSGYSDDIEDLYSDPNWINEETAWEEDLSQDLDSEVQGFDAPAPVSQEVVANDRIHGIEKHAESGAGMTARGDIYPVQARLRWVGYNYNERDSYLQVEMLTDGNPEFDVFQEINQSRQPEIVVRFLQTTLRRKIRRDIDATEFRSPVAYIRMREDDVEQYVDVVLTMRDAIKPRLHAEEGNVLLTFEIPERYKAPRNELEGHLLAVAESLQHSDLIGDIAPQVRISEQVPSTELVVDEIKEAFVPNPVANAFSDVPDDFGVKLEVLEPVEAKIVAEIPSPTDLPENFERRVDTQTQSAETTAKSEREAPPSQPKQSESNVYDDSMWINALQGANTGPAYDSSQFDQEAHAPMQPYAAPTQPYAAPTQPYAAPTQPYAAPTQPYGYAQPSYVAPQQAQPGAQNQFYYDYGNGNGDFNFHNNYDFDQFKDEGLDEFDFDIDGRGGSDDVREKFEVHRLPLQKHDMLLAHSIYGGGVAKDSLLSGFNFQRSFTTDRYFDSIGMDGANNYFGGTNNFAMEPSSYDGAFNAAADGDLLGSDSEFQTEQYSGKPIAIEFYEARLSNVLKVFTDQTGINFIYPQSVAEVTITVKLTDVPWDAALRGILEANNLSMARVTDSIVRIDFVERIRESLEAKRAAKREKSLDMETKVMVFRLSYARGTDLVEIAQNMLQDPNGDLPAPNVRADDRTNSLVVEGIGPVLNKAKAIIERLDTPTLQAEIAIRVVEVSKTTQNFLGIRWGGALNFDGGRGLGFGSVLFPNSLTSNFAIDASGSNNEAPGQFNFRFGSLNEVFDLDLRLRLEEQKNTTEILQSTKVIVQDGQKAEIGSGSVDYIRRTVVSGVAGTSEQPQAVGVDEITYELVLGLEEVRISRDGMVTMMLALDSETPSATTVSKEATAGSNRRRVRTTLVKQTGETAVIGGIYNVRRINHQVGIPFLSSLPLIGPLFRSSSKTESQNEMLVMLTPKIIGNEGGSLMGASAIGPTAIPADTGFNTYFDDSSLSFNYGGGNDSTSSDGFDESGNGDWEFNDFNDFNDLEGNDSSNFGDFENF